jgi:acyl-CoA thioesterase
MFLQGLSATIFAVLCSAVGNRGLAFGRIWRRDGVLAVSCAQEGVIRFKAFL